MTRFPFDPYMTTLSAPSHRLLDRLARDGRWAESDASTPLPNQHPVLRTAWTSSGSLSFDRIRNNMTLGTLEPVFTGLGMTSMIASRIHARDVGLGLLCIDETDGNRSWTSAEHRRLDRFVEQRLAPVLDASLRRHASRRSQLTEAEGDAVRLLADGHSYSSIAHELGKSARTIDNQLRSARSKAGVHTSIDLVRWWSDLAGEPAIADR